MVGLIDADVRGIGARELVEDLAANTAGAHDHLNSYWRQLNLAAQQATFEVAKAAKLSAEADMRIDGRSAVVCGNNAIDDGPPPPPPAELVAREPHVKCARAVDVHVTSEDGQGSCEAFTKGLARVCTQKHGTQFEVGVAAKRLVCDANGRCVGVEVERRRTDDSSAPAATEVLKVDAVVLCAGACVAPLAASASLYVPVQPLRGYSLSATASSKASLRHHITFSPNHLYAARLGDTLRFSCYGELAPVRADGPGEPTAGLVARLRKLVEEEISNVSAICEWEGAVSWVGARPLTPDSYPLAGGTRVADQRCQQ